MSRSGGAYFESENGLTVGSISVALTQLEKTVVLFEAINADTPLSDKSDEIDWLSTSLQSSPQKFLCSPRSDKKRLTIAREYAPLHLHYVDKEWWGKTTTDKKATKRKESMSDKKKWLFLPDKKYKQAHKRAEELAKHWYVFVCAVCAMHKRMCVSTEGP